MRTGHVMVSNFHVVIIVEAFITVRYYHDIEMSYYLFYHAILFISLSLWLTKCVETIYRSPPWNRFGQISSLK